MVIRKYELSGGFSVLALKRVGEMCVKYHSDISITLSITEPWIAMAIRMVMCCGRWVTCPLIRRSVWESWTRNSRKLSCIIFCSNPAPTCSDVFGHCHNVLTLFWPCSDVFSHSVTTITMLRPCSDVFSHTITILQFRTLTPLIFVMLHPLPDLCHHSRFCG